METFSQHITKDDSIIIRVAAFIADKGTEGATWKELIEFFHLYNHLTNEERDALITNPESNNPVYDKFFKLIRSYLTDDTFTRIDDRLTINFGGLSQLLDFIELKHARKNAREARTFSAWAIGISALALIVSSVFGYMQLNNKVEIEDSQLEYLHEKSDYSPKLDSINLQLKRMNNHFDTLIIK